MKFGEKLSLKYLIVIYIFIISFFETHSTEFGARTFSQFKTKTSTESNLRASTSTFSSTNLKFKDQISVQKMNPEMNIVVENGVPIDKENFKIDIHKLTFYYNVTDWKGWVKYFKIQKGEKPKSFYKNFYYYKQIKELPVLDLNSKTDDIFDFIRDDNFFYVTVVKDNIIISNTRKQKFSTIYQAINIHNIAPIDEKGEGGIVDFGHHPEGYCFKLLTSQFKVTSPLPNGFDTIDYVFCCENLKDKDKFVNILVQLKLNLQKDDIIVNLPRETLAKREGERNLDSIICETEKKKNIAENIPDYSEDGRWVIVKDWSQCSVKCGGGISVLQRYCVPPIGNGKPCEGEGILKKECNLTPCNLYIKHYQTTPKKVITKPDIKIMPFSDRPQRYIKCKVKESDLMMFKKIKNNDKEKIVYEPVRVVMNNFTLSIYQSSEFESNDLNFDLPKTEIKPSTAHLWCFILTEMDKEAELCNFHSHDNKSNEKFIFEWKKDFDLFKNNCHTGRFTNPVEKIQVEIKEKMAEIEAEMEKEKTMKIHDKIEEEKREKLVESKQKIIELGEVALHKEKMLEKFVLEEKLSQEDNKIEQIKHKLEEEKEKEKKIFESTDEEQVNEDEALDEIRAEHEMENIKKIISNKILDSREEFTRKLKEKERLKIKEIENLNSQIIEVKNTIGKEFDNPNKNGSIQTCAGKINFPEFQKTYCLRNYTSSKIRWFFECTNGSFCTACCQNEFGANLKNERLECIKKACSKNL